MSKMQGWKKRFGAVALTTGLAAGGFLALGPASPAAAASCTGQSQGGVNSSSANWVQAKPYLCSGTVRGGAKRVFTDTPPVTYWGPWSSTTSTGTTTTSGTRGGGSVQSNAGGPTVTLTENNVDATLRNRVFTW